MSIESDRLAASIAALDTKVDEAVAFILANAGNGAATAAQLIEFADKVDADVNRLTAAMTPVVEEPPVEDEEPAFTE